ncbi:hypothetical protein PFDG_04796 [Plasmodium falciparum Dd2]|uniref:Uncharacterized protein n=1 Tax=Plasmodium falciparum (isolate Dd2) TaxID=57267 RepID=A0A0L7M8R9_PLAF4|nr:hypothetical protein PFDG_04796 [Plasmodium falciparum Dd2]
MVMLPLHENSSTIRKKYKKDNKFFGGETSGRIFWEEFFYKKKRQKKNEKGTNLNSKISEIYMQKPVNIDTFNILYSRVFRMIIFFIKIDILKKIL